MAAPEGTGNKPAMLTEDFAGLPFRCEMRQCTNACVPASRRTFLRHGPYLCAAQASRNAASARLLATPLLGPSVGARAGEVVVSLRP
jgi:hypothetical protein